MKSDRFAGTGPLKWFFPRRSHFDLELERFAECDPDWVHQEMRRNQLQGVHLSDFCEIA